MIGRRSLMLIRTLFEYSSIFRYTTFRWDSSSKDFLVYAHNPVTSIFSKFRVSRLGCKLVNAVTLLVIPYSTFRIFYGAIVLKQSFQDIMFQVFILGSYILGGIHVACNWIKEDPIPFFFTLFIRFDRKLTEKFQMKPVKDVSFLYMLTIGIIAFGEIPALVVLYLINWDKPVYLGSLMEYIPREHLTAWFIAFTIFFCIEFLIIVGVVFNGLIYAYVLILFWHTSRRWLKEMTVGHGKYRQKILKDDMYEPNTIFMVYRQWQICLIVLNDRTDFLLLLSHFVTGSLLVLSSFSTIQFWGPKNVESLVAFITYAIYPAASIIFAIWVIMILPLAADIKIESRKFQNFWKTFNLVHKEKNMANLVKYSALKSKYFVKSIHSCRELKIQIGTFFSYNKSSMPQTLDVCIDGTITLLLGI